MRDGEKRISLAGNDWEADYFLSEAQYNAWRSRSRNLQDMLRSDAGNSGFVRGAEAPWAMRGTIPGCDRTILLENGVCADPFYARNLEHTRFAEKYSWAFRKRFSVPETWRGDRVCIDFRGIDYQAVFFLNGEWFGQSVGMFMPARYDVTGLVKFGAENLLAVVFAPAPQGTPNHRDHEPADFAGFHRTQIGFGWDWSRGIVPTGIWDEVSVFAYSEIMPGVWRWCWDGREAALELEFDARRGGGAAAHIRLTPADFSGSGSEASDVVTAVPGRNRCRIAVPVPEDVRFWYPNGMGLPALYTLEVELGEWHFTAQVGFRTVTMTRNPDSPAGAYDLTFNLNGEAVFARGVNYVPADLLPSRVTAADYEHLVAEAAAAGINLFRIWGGGMVEKDAFYAACDRHGIMVWQEFMHACSNYPKDAEYLAFKEREGAAILRKLRNHPCLAMLCGGNEMQYYGEIPDSPLLQNYRRLAAELVPELPFHTSCPDLSRPGERNHGPWNYRDHDFWNGHFRQLASEVGCNAMPELDSLRKFIPESEIAVLNGPALEYHFYNRVNVYDLGRPLEIFDVRTPGEFCQASMFAQSDALQYVMEHYRRLFPRASGCFFWQYNEPWPTCAFSIIDYYGTPKMALYGMKRACAPVLLSLEDDSWCRRDGKLSGTWYITCDRPFAGTAGVRGVAADGTELFRYECSGEWGCGTVRLRELDEPLPEGLTAVFFTLDGAYAGVRVYGAPDFRRAFAGAKPAVTAAVGDGTILVRNPGPAVAFHVRLNFPELDPKRYVLADNYLVLAPGETREVGFSGGLRGRKAEISMW
ncbi:MAG: hypothetical protein MR051_07555 [Lentisphaeria bacterium]|nr:hypothetical protein [Lentisphaeria bacterium]